METPRAGQITVVVLTVLAFIVRFAKLNHPDQVVYVSAFRLLGLDKLSFPPNSFDEVHFGKFAAYYLRREYYFDVHPPFAKLLLALAGWFVGFEGDFDFANIGDSYTANNVPYWGMRALPAILGSLTVPAAYYIMQESGYSTIAAAFSAIIILFGGFPDTSSCSTGGTNWRPDNAHVTQSRLILLDAILIFFMSLTIYSYIKFRKYRYQ